MITTIHLLFQGTRWTQNSMATIKWTENRAQPPTGQLEPRRNDSKFIYLGFIKSHRLPMHFPLISAMFINTAMMMILEMGVEFI